MDVAGKAGRAEIMEEVFAEPAGAFEPGNVGGRETEVRQIIERLLKSGGEQETAPLRQGADEQFEDGRSGIAMVQISLDHVDLIEVRQQRTICGFPCGGLGVLPHDSRWR